MYRNHSSRHTPCAVTGQAVTETASGFGTRSVPTTIAPRRALVLVAVLIVVVLLSLAAYNYAELMTKEFKASDYAIRYAQAKASAEAGIHYAAALLAHELSGSSELLGGNFYDNSQYFQGIAVATNDSPRNSSKFSIYAMHYEDPASGMSMIGTPGPASGVFDEASKININALMMNDTSGTTLYNWLMQLPNMTDPIANSIVYWLDPTATTRSSGADNTYYMGLGYQAKNGPVNSLEELLWVQGMTPQLLFGDDINRNGIQDNGESISDTSGMFGRGWSQFLTIYSREPNISMMGAPRININDTTNDLQTIYTNLSAVIDTDLAMFIVLARLYGTTASSSSGATGGAGGGGRNTAASLGGVQLSDIAPSGTMGKSNITSLYDLIGASVTVTKTATKQTTNPKGGTTTTVTTTTTVYNSPLTDNGSIQSLFPALYDATTTSAATTLPGRVNVNTAGQTVLQSICSKKAASTGASTGTTGATAATDPTAGPTPILNAQQIEQIISMQPTFTGGQAQDPMFQCPIWMITEAQIPPTTMKQLDPYITTYSQVYSFQSIGYFDSGGLAVRFEAVVDLNPAPNTATTGTPGSGLTCYPRILYQRDISQLLGFESLLPKQ
jgi:Type II secretion system (T2SS), protein K